MFFELKLVFELNTLLNNAIGVKMKKNIIANSTLGMIWLKMYESLNHIVSIKIDDFNEKTPRPEKINDR